MFKPKLFEFPLSLSKKFLKLPLLKITVVTTIQKFLPLQWRRFHVRRKTTKTFPSWCRALLSVPSTGRSAIKQWDPMRYVFLFFLFCFFPLLSNVGFVFYCKQNGVISAVPQLRFQICKDNRCTQTHSKYSP